MSIYKIQYQKENSDNPSLQIVMSGNLSINTIEEIKRDLDANVDMNQNINIIIKDINIIDISLLQLIYAIKKSMESKNKEFHYKLELNQEYKELISLAGFKIEN